MLRKTTVTAPADEGFSLVETIVALAIAATVLLGLLGSGLFAVRSAVTARQNAAAGDLLNKTIESARSLEYASITMKTSDLGTDSRISTGTPRTFDPGPDLAPEPIDAQTVGSISPHIEVKPGPNATYTVARYVTLPPGTTFDANGQPSARRLSVVVTWSKNGISRERTTSTILTKTRRGLPLPRYTFAYNGPATLVAGKPTFAKNPGNDLSYGLVIRNQGARDAWVISASTAAGWRYYADVDKNGLWAGDATEPELTSASTGLLEPGSLPFYLVAHRVVGISESGTSTTTFTATPQSEASVPGKTMATGLTVTNGAVVVPTATASPTPTPTSSSAATCTPGTATTVTDGLGVTAATRPGNSYTITNLNLLNGPGVEDTTTQSVSTMTAATGSLQSQLCNWSTDQQTAQAGRLLTTSGVAPFGKAEWRFKATGNNGQRFGGTAVVVLHVQCPAAGATVNVSLQSVASSVPTVRQTASLALPSSCNASTFQRVDISLVLPEFVVDSGANDWLALTVTSNAAVRLAHGLTGKTSRLVVAIK